ncbi:MlaC/ttg2D family ABC transporter substrate-binding protein [Marinobacter sp. 1Y8]
MITRVWIMMLTLMVAAMTAVPASASEDLRQYVDTSTQKLVNKLQKERSLYSKDPDAFYRSMDETLGDFVDFRRIAARVMGRYARQASREQRDQFVETFKRSLFDSYAKALVEADKFTIDVKSAEINPNNDQRASVQLEVRTASGNRYPVTYSMYVAESGDWMMENVIVEGVNIGLAFRDRFAQEMEEKRNNVQAVIDDWTEAVKELKLDEEVEGK